jgi:hypothetical protein
MVGDKSLTEMLNTKTLKGLNEIESIFGKNEENTSLFDAIVYEWLLKGEERIIRSVKNISDFLEITKTRSDFETGFNNKKPNIFDDGSGVINQMNGLLERKLEEDKINLVKAAVYISQFKEWIKKAKSAGTLKDIDAVNDMKNLGKIKDSDIVEWIKEKLSIQTDSDEENDDTEETNTKKGKKKTLLDIIVDRLDVRQCKKITVLWELVLVYELKESDTNNKAETYYNKTIEAVGIFDDKTNNYSKFFTKYIFK